LTTRCFCPRSRTRRYAAFTGAGIVVLIDPAEATRTRGGIVGTRPRHSRRRKRPRQNRARFGCRSGPAADANGPGADGPVPRARHSRPSPSPGRPGSARAGARRASGRPRSRGRERHPDGSARYGQAGPGSGRGVLWWLGGWATAQVVRHEHVLLPAPPTGLADGFGREGRPTADGWPADSPQITVGPRLVTIRLGGSAPVSPRLATRGPDQTGRHYWPTSAVANPSHQAKQ
jgi:hypothetical protein